MQVILQEIENNFLKLSRYPYNLGHPVCSRGKICWTVHDIYNHTIENRNPKNAGN